MKITNVRTTMIAVPFARFGEFQPVTMWYMKRHASIHCVTYIDTDEGINGYGECSVSRAPFAAAGAIEDLKPVLVGTDPRAYEMLFWEMSHRAIAGPLGVRAKAIAGFELALLDIKAKSLGISVVELFGGPTREKVRLYWSHCGTTRALYPEMGKPPIRTMRDIADLGKEVVRRGYTPSRPISSSRETLPACISTALEEAWAGLNRRIRWRPPGCSSILRP